MWEGGKHGWEVGTQRGGKASLPPSISACRSDVQSKMSIKFTRVDFCGVSPGGSPLPANVGGSHDGKGTVQGRVANEKPLKKGDLLY